MSKEEIDSYANIDMLFCIFEYYKYFFRGICIRGYYLAVFTSRLLS